MTAQEASENSKVKDLERALGVIKDFSDMGINSYETERPLKKSTVESLGILGYRVTVTWQGHRISW